MSDATPEQMTHISYYKSPNLDVLPKRHSRFSGLILKFWPDPEDLLHE